MGEGNKAVVAAREQAIATLTEAFSKDEIGMDELESRLDRAHREEDEAALVALVKDLTPAQGALVRSASTLPVEQAEPHQVVKATFGSVERRGVWNGAKKMVAGATFGSIELDFREARLPSGVIELEVSALFGSVEIIVPPELAVENHGSAMFGSFDVLERAPASPDPDRPLLRIKGKAVFGSVEVHTRLPSPTLHPALTGKKGEGE